jgi:hypothetical protein
MQLVFQMKTADTLDKNSCLWWIWGSHSNDYEAYNALGCNNMQFIKVHWHFGGHRRFNHRMILDFCCSGPHTLRRYFNKWTWFTKANKSSASKAQSKWKGEELEEALKKNKEEILPTTVTRALEILYFVQNHVFNTFISESKYLSMW